MVDIQCIREALEKMGCTNIVIQQRALSFVSSGTAMQYSIANNGVLLTTSRDPRYNQLVQFMSQIETNYTQVLQEKQERIRKEQERLAEIERKKRALERELVNAGDSLKSESSEAVNKANARLEELNQEIKSSQKSLEEAQSFMNQVENSKKEFVSKTIEEITAKGKEKGWSMAAKQVIKKGQANVTRLQLRKKQLN